MIYSQTATHEARLQTAMSRLLTVWHADSRPKREGDSVKIKMRRGEETFDVYLNWLSWRRFAGMRSRYGNQFDQTRIKAWGEDVPMVYGTSSTVRSYFREGLLAMKLPVGSILDLGELVNVEINKKNAQAKAKAAQTLLQQQNLDEIADDEVGEDESTPAKKPQLQPIRRLQAYIVNYKGKRIGVLRIPSYGGQLKAEIRWVSEVLKRMENTTDVAILDVLSNGGGSVHYGIRLLSMLAGKQALQSITANTRLTETLIYNLTDPDSRKDYETGEPLNYAADQVETLIAERWEKKYLNGERWTGQEPYFSNVATQSGNGIIVPDQEALFTKDFIVANDKYSASGGDFIPAMLQANRRALVQGETSQGLGGPVYRQIESMPGSEMSLRCTMGYCERSDGWPIENVGVVPDLYRGVTVEDLNNNFKDYAEDLLESALALAEKKSALEMQKSLRERIAKRLKKDKKLDDKLAPLKTLIAEFKGSPIYIAAESNLTVHAQEIVQAYRQLLQNLQTKGKDLKSEEWRSLLLPLPKPLVQSDRILATLWRKDETIERLRTLERLPRLQTTNEADIQLVWVANQIAQVLRDIPGEIRTNDPCELWLKPN